MRFAGLLIAAIGQEREAALDKLYVSMGYPLFGSVMASIGDVDRDGRVDVVVVDPGYEEHPSYERMLWILSGKDSHVLIARELRDPMTRCAGIGDLDGDEVPDFVLWNSEGKEPDVFAGSTGLSLGSKQKGASQGGSLTSMPPGWKPGICMSRGSDRTGGAVLFVGGEATVYAFAGATGRSLWCAYRPSDRGECLTLAIIGDVDSDGEDEVVVAWPWPKNGWPRIEALSGKTGQRLWETEGPTSMAHFGISIAAIDDRDGDQVMEILVGCDNGVLHEPGRIWILSGKTGRAIGILERKGSAVRERDLTDDDRR